MPATYRQCVRVFNGAMAYMGEAWDSHGGANSFLGERKRKLAEEQMVLKEYDEQARQDYGTPYVASIDFYDPHVGCGYEDQRLYLNGDLPAEDITETIVEHFDWPSKEDEARTLERIRGDQTIWAGDCKP